MHIMIANSTWSFQLIIPFLPGLSLFFCDKSNLGRAKFQSVGGRRGGASPGWRDLYPKGRSLGGVSFRTL
jgi:hypothetical protein